MAKQGNQKSGQKSAPKEILASLWELFDAEDEAFLQTLLHATIDRKYLPLIKNWYFDERPFARRMLLRYIDDGCDRPWHRLLVKRLLRLAERNNDDEAMSHFLVAFDRLHRRKLVQIRLVDAWGEVETRSVLRKQNPQIPERYLSRGRSHDASIFSRRTRVYLQRRAFRYFRRIAGKDPARYGRLIRETLCLYQDIHLRSAESLLDAWGLMHALYWGSPVLDRQSRGIVVREGRSMSELSAAPFCPKAWKGVFDEVWGMLKSARCRTVRVFAIQLLQKQYADQLKQLPLRQILDLLRSPHQEMQNFGVDLLIGYEDLARVPVSDWFAMLQIDNPTALSLLCDLVEEHVKPDALHLSDCVTLAKSRVARVAELGFSWIRERSFATEEELRALLPLGNAEAPSVRAQAVDFLLQELVASPHFSPEHLRELIDSKFEDVRERALALMQAEPSLRDDFLLWGALAESPYEDVRAFLIKNLEAREKSFLPETIRALWASSLLAIARGGGKKRMAVNQIANRIAKSPGEAEDLLPLLAIALRSVRAPERVSALAAISRAAFINPSLKAAIQQKLPELCFLDEVVA